MGSPILHSPYLVNAKYPGIFDLLGQVSDARIAKQYGCVKQAVGHMRRRFEIPVGGKAPPELLARISQPPPPKRRRRTRSHGSLHRERHDVDYMDCKVTVFIWAHTDEAALRPWRIAIELPGGREERPSEEADHCASQDEALARARWHCEQMIAGVAA